MSKKKGKVVVKKAPKKAAKKVAKKAVRKATAKRATARLASAASSGRTLHATIFISKTDRGTTIRTSPQRLYANPGDFIEWTVVNLVDGDNDVPVTVSWPETGPWGKDPIDIRSWKRVPFGDATGRFKFVVTALGAEEDPEIELPDGN
ncbi:MAG TPA: hypothetical protein VNT81_05230 [Vicinamibacterales bacterium]|nr:hypothetical protein [Vicinamibacterales bacterium]